uniref:Uncharacterized protein n=1 Tax=Promethearchaeum syntrophicum TaxID=2594042 RepID=A0A5B9D6V4_9ARCH|nr:hypothetical protein DSAG12_00679 [Candidatus Prometheoarchaeum syntrophicum]
MVQKRPSILDFQIKNYLLFYKFPKYYLGFYSIRIYDTNIVDLLIKTLKKALFNEKIFGVIDICGENTFLFIKIKNKSLKTIFNIENDILLCLSTIKKKIIYELQMNKELENSFFYFVEFSQMKNVHISINKNEKFISLIDDKIANEKYIFKFEFGDSFFRENQIKQLILFFQTMKIKGYFLFSHKNENFFKISFIIITQSYEKLINFLNFNNSLPLIPHLKLVEISKIDFVNFIKKKQLSNSVLIEKVDFYNLIKNFNLDRKIDQDIKIKFLEEKENNSLLKKITSILNEMLIEFTLNSKSDILINAYKIRILIIENNFNLLLYYFKNQGYLKYETILIFSNKVELKALMLYTNIKKLKRINLFSKDNLELFRILLNQHKNFLLASF